MIRCSGCTNPICDPYYLYTDNRCFHADCLRCNVCNVILNNDRSMFLKKGMILCKSDYIRITSGSCSGCGQLIPANCFAVKIPCPPPPGGPQNGWLHYHPTCLHCSKCRQPMNTGDKFILRQDNRGVICLNNDCVADCRLPNQQTMVANAAPTPTTGRKRGRQAGSVNKAKAEKLNQF